MLRFGLIISAVVFVLDQFTKWLVLGPGQFSPSGCREVGYNCRFIELTPFFDLQMVWNRGISFGLLRADEGLARWGLVLSSLLIAGFFVWWLRTADRRVTAAALGLVIGGALGNVIDRIRFGAVADFLDFNGLGFFPWVFNVADAGITVGALLLAFDMIFLSEEPGKGTLWSQLKRRFEGSRGGAQGGEGG